MKNAPVRHRVEYVFYRAAKGFIRSLSHPGVRRFGHRLGRTAWRLLSRQRRQALDNLSLTLPKLGPDEHQRIARGCFEHFGAYFCEFLSEGRFNREQSLALFDIEGWEHVQAAEDAGRGFFLMTGHFGCFELGGHPVALRLGQVHMVARPADNPFVEADLVGHRERFGNRVIGKQGAARRMLGAVRKGGRVGIVIDQRARPDVGIRVPFLGHMAWNSPALAFLSVRTGAPVVPISTEPLPGGRYKLSIRPPIEPMKRGEGAEEALTRRYLEDIEVQIRRRPELYLWMHRKWAP